MDGPLTICGISINPGNKIYRMIKVAEDYNGPIEFPLLAVNGSKPGRCLAITAGLYGDEYTAMEAIFKLFRELRPEKVYGQIVAIPMLNISAFDRISRLGSDLINMNRIKGGSKKGFLTEKIAHIALHEVISKADYAVELIEIGMLYKTTAFVGLVKVNNKYDLDFAKAFGCDLLWIGSAAPTVFRKAVAKRNINIIQAQIGGEGRCYSKNVHYELFGIKNLLKYLGIIDGKPEKLPSKYHFYNGFWMHSNTGGILRCNLKLRQKVKKGDVLATIYNILDKELEKIRAPYDGIVIGYRTVPRIFPGDWTVWICSYQDTEQVSG